MRWELHPSNVGTGLPLEGVRVLDLSRVLAGPLAAMILGDLGADVIKVEAPDGDPVRRLAPPWFGADATYYLAVNRHRRAITLDLRTEAERQQLSSLIELADVVIENYLPYQRVLLGIDELRAMHPSAIWVSVTPASGETTLAQQPTFDLLAQARSGLMGVTGERGGQALKVGAPLADVVTGLYAAIGAVSGLVGRRTNANGLHVEAPLLESTMTALVNQAQGYLATGVAPERLGNDHPSIAPYGPVATRDGVLFIAVGTDTQFATLVDALRATALRESRWARNEERVRARDELGELLDVCFAERTTDEWMSLLQSVGVPCAPVYDVPDAFSQAQIKDGDFVVTTDGPHGAFATMASPLRLNGVRPPVRRGPRAFAQDQDEVLGD